MKRWWSSLIVIVGLVMLFGCTANEQAGQDTGGKGNHAEKEQVLKLNNENEPTSFDPPIGFDNVSWQALNNLMEGLTRLGSDHEPEALQPKNGTFPMTERHILLQSASRRNGQMAIR